VRNDSKPFLVLKPAGLRTEELPIAYERISLASGVLLQEAQHARAFGCTLLVLPLLLRLQLCGLIFPQWPKGSAMNAGVQASSGGGQAISFGASYWYKLSYVGCTKRDVSSLQCHEGSAMNAGIQVSSGGGQATSRACGGLSSAKPCGYLCQRLRKCRLWPR